MNCPFAPQLPRKRAHLGLKSEAAVGLHCMRSGIRLASPGTRTSVAKGAPMIAQLLSRALCRRSLLAGTVAVVLTVGVVPAHAQDTLKLGLVAAMSGQS